MASVAREQEMARAGVSNPRPGMLCNAAGGNFYILYI
jgi:hypothetical protein